MQERKRASLEAWSDLRTPWCMHVEATLRIADHIAAGANGDPITSGFALLPSGGSKKEAAFQRIGKCYG